MTEKILIYKAGSEAIQKVFSNCILWALLFALGGAIFEIIIIPSDNFIWYIPAIFSIAGILLKLRSYRDVYAGLILIGTGIGFLTGVAAAALIGSEPLMTYIQLSLIFALNGFLVIWLPFLS